MRLKPTFQSITGANPGIIRHKEYPALTLARSPYYNVWFEQGSNMHQQTQDLHHEQEMDHEIRMAASAAGVDLREITEEMRHNRRVEKNSEMQIKQFAAYSRQQNAILEAEIEADLRKIDESHALKAKRSELRLATPPSFDAAQTSAASGQYVTHLIKSAAKVFSKPQELEEPAKFVKKEAKLVQSSLEVDRSVNPPRVTGDLGAPLAVEATYPELKTKTRRGRSSEAASKSRTRKKKGETQLS